MENDLRKTKRGIREPKLSFREANWRHSQRWAKIPPWKAHAYFDRVLRMGEEFSPRDIIRSFFEIFKEK